MWGNKPVAKEVTSLQTLIPSLKGMARIGTTYKHHERFSRIFNVRRKDKDGRNEYAKQVGFGFGERFLLGLLEHHADSYGFRFTSTTAPTQMAILSSDASYRSKVEHLKQKLDKYRISIDDDYSSHIKKRLKKHLVYGTPLRVTVISDDSLLYSRRDTLDRAECSIDYFVSHVDKILHDIDDSLRYRSQEFFTDNLVQTNSLAEIGSILDNNKVALVNHCLQESCGKTLEDKYPGELLGKVLTKNIRNDAPCILCGNEKGYISAYAKRDPNP
jgi:prolyl-tRNA synthetase